MITILKAIKKRSHEPIYITNKKKLSKRIKSDNFCYRKVGRGITKWGAIEKSPILLSQHWKICIAMYNIENKNSLHSQVYFNE